MRDELPFFDPEYFAGIRRLRDLERRLHEIHAEEVRRQRAEERLWRDCFAHHEPSEIEKVPCPPLSEVRQYASLDHFLASL